jgi:hypothetical protein
MSGIIALKKETNSTQSVMRKETNSTQSTLDIESLRTVEKPKESGKLRHFDGLR